MSWDKLLKQRAGGDGDFGLWWGEIDSAPDGGRVDVLIPDRHPSKPYSALLQDPRPADPSVGDRCLIAFDNDGDPWVVVWNATA